MYMKSLIIFIGGFLGAISRFTVSNIIEVEDFPINTLLINILGCFLLSFILTYCTSKIREEYILLLGTGFMGAFTTFSTFSLETVQLFNNGQFILVASYVSLSISVGVIAAFLGYYLSKKLLDSRAEKC